MPSIFIDDGFTLSGEVEAQHGFPAVKFKYRLAHPEKVYAFTTEQKPTGKQRHAAICRMLAEQLVEWDATTPDGNAVPISEMILHRVAHPILERMMDHVLGYGPDYSQREQDEKN